MIPTARTQGTSERSISAGLPVTPSSDIRIEADGALQTIDVPDLDCYNEGPSSDLQSCTSTADVWDGRVRLPDTGPAKIDLDICISQSGIWTSYHEVTVDIVNTPNGTPTRAWVQNGAATIVPAYCCALEDTYFEDYYPNDNVKAVLL